MFSLSSLFLNCWLMNHLLLFRFFFYWNFFILLSFTQNHSINSLWATVAWNCFKFNIMIIGCHLAVFWLRRIVVLKLLSQFLWNPFSLSITVCFWRSFFLCYKKWWLLISSKRTSYWVSSRCSLDLVLLVTNVIRELW